MAWKKGNPKSQGEFIVIDGSYHHLAIGHYRTDLGWCINGRWLGHDAVDWWLDPRDLPPLPDLS